MQKATDDSLNAARVALTSYLLRSGLSKYFEYNGRYFVDLNYTIRGKKFGKVRKTSAYKEYMSTLS